MKMGIVVSHSIDAKELDAALYRVYKVNETMDINAIIRKAMNDGCSSVLAFVENSKQEAQIKRDEAIKTIVTKCSGISAGFYVKQAEMFIQARVNLEDIYKSITQSLHNYHI